jgi:hypothetical protein
MVQTSPTVLTELAVDSLAISGVDVVTALLLAGGQAVDLNGEADALILDSDADTTISSPTDDQIDIEIAGADDFTFTANTFTALSGSTIKTNTIAETTSAAGVTIDGALVKDGRTDAGRISQELTSSGAITINSGLVLLNHATVAVDATLDAPAVGDELIITDNSASGTAAHNVVLAAGVTWDGTNDTITFDAPGETIHAIAISATRFLILENIGSVALSSS